MTPDAVKNYRVDKTGWRKGPWMTEPDRVDFRHAGFPCLILRQRDVGFLCGYVGVPPGHVAHGKDYGDVDVNVHGELSYSAACDGERICHVPEPGEPDDVHWLGFDCMHTFDMAPVRPDGWYFVADRQYRDVAYVRREVESLAEQLAAMARR